METATPIRGIPHHANNFYGDKGTPIQILARIFSADLSIITRS